MAARRFGSTTKDAAGWRVRYSHEGTQVRVPGVFKTEKQALAKLALIHAEILKGEHIDQNAGAVLFRDHAAKVMAIRKTKVAPGTYRNNMGQLKNHLLPRFGDLPLSKITASEIDVWHASMADRPSLRFQTYNVLRSLMVLAVKWHHIRENPCQVEDARKNISKKRPVFSVEDFTSVVAQTPEEFHVVAWTLFGAHPRISEMLALKRSDFDAEAGTLLIERQLQEGKLVPTKTGVVRTVDVLEPGLSLLRDYVKQNPMFPSTFLFRTNTGQPINEPYVRKVWNPAREAAGVADMRIHDIRHVSLSWVGHSGAGIDEVMERAGHLDSSTTMIYMASDKTRKKEAAAAASALLMARLSA